MPNSRDDRENQDLSAGNAYSGFYMQDTKFALKRKANVNDPVLAVRQVIRIKKTLISLA